MQIRSDAGELEIKKAYRRLALLYHPDHNKSPKAHSYFVSINQAYTILIDATKRKRYDAQLLYGLKSGASSNVTSHKPATKYDEDKGRKYGTKHKFDTKNGKARKGYSRKDQKQFELAEVAMFYSLMGFGILSIVLAIEDLFYKEWEGINSLSGIIFGLSFTLLLAYSWRQLYRKND